MWSLCSLPSTVENFLCVDEYPSYTCRAYAIQRGLNGRIRRKELLSVGYVQIPTTQKKHRESWHNPEGPPSIFNWIMVSLFCLSIYCVVASRSEASATASDRPYHTIQPSSSRRCYLWPSGFAQFSHLLQLHKTPARTAGWWCYSNWGTAHTNCARQWMFLFQAVCLVVSKLCGGWIWWCMQHTIVWSEVFVMYTEAVNSSVHTSMLWLSLY